MLYISQKQSDRRKKNTYYPRLLQWIAVIIICVCINTLIVTDNQKIYLLIRGCVNLTKWQTRVGMAKKESSR